MNKDFDRLNLGSITVRFSINVLKEIDSQCGPKQKYRDHSDAIRSLVALGMQVESLLEIQRDPEKKQEFETKLASILQEKNVEQSLETMDADQLRGLSFFLETLKNKKVQLLLDEIKQS